RKPNRTRTITSISTEDESSDEPSLRASLIFGGDHPAQEKTGAKSLPFFMPGDGTQTEIKEAAALVRLPAWPEKASRLKTEVWPVRARLQGPGRGPKPAGPQPRAAGWQERSGPGRLPPELEAWPAWKHTCPHGRWPCARRR